ncbi:MULTISPECIES: DMT family transporter [Methylomonas]|uniref:EamA domain-containing protein n=1 Tax=Methylomonas koyamae TaxID=702114 RepID=A0A177NRT2_9GAMM|nr:DMT family transporter [Methylomonas koyamae]OAI19740.1 hypothetical protein A1355_03695 [Methylomonas koyamae]
MNLPNQPRGADGRAACFGMLGILGFSLTLPATRLAVADLDPVFVGLGRAVVAAGLAAVVLWWAKAPRPSLRQCGRLALVAAGVVVGFPLLSTLALHTAAAAHAAVIVGLAPLATALCAAWLAGERPGIPYWTATLIGGATIVGFCWWIGGGGLSRADWLLLGAVASVGFGYAEGARMSRELGAWQTISWALLLAAPCLLPAVWLAAPAHWAAVGWTSLGGFAYVSLVSMYLAFFAWYKGLAMGGIARIGQLQLLQPFLTLAGAALILGEAVGRSQMIAASIVLVCVILGRREPRRLRVPALSHSDARSP